MTTPTKRKTKTTKTKSCQKRKVKKVMGEFKRGKLKTGEGKKVKTRPQALAIALSEARRKCAIRRRRKAAAAKKK